jgi:hypothetical protein
MFGFLKRKPDPMVDMASVDMTNFLIDRGFTPEEAAKTSMKFWSHNREKLRNVV